MTKRHLLFNLLLAVLVLISIPAFALAQGVDSDNIVIVFDDSGSMNDNLGAGIDKMSAAKTALLEIMKDVPATTNVGLVSFHKDWLYKLGPVDKVKFKAAVDVLRQSGGTPLSEYIKIGADSLLVQREKQLNYGSYRLLVVTDGDSTDGDDYRVFVPEIMARGITVDVIGVGMQTQHDLATRVHTYYNADNPESLQTAVKKVFAEIGGRGGGITNEEAFELIAPLPDGFALGVIKSLAKTGNHPIGERPVEANNAQNGQQDQQQDSGGGFLLVIIAAIVVVLAAVLFLAL